MMTKLIRVMIVEDHPMFRESVVEAIEAEDGYEIIAQATDGGSAVSLAKKHNPDVIIMDIHLPVKNGIEAITEIIADNPDAHILTLTSSTDNDKVLVALQAGALGYLLKDSPRAIFLEGLRNVAAGHQYLTPEVATMLAKSLRPARPSEHKEEHPDDKLTERERKVLQLLGLGLSNRQIAQSMVVSESTVRVHIFHLLAKLKLADRNQAILYAISISSGDKTSI